MKENELIEALILNGLHKYPEGLTTRQIQKMVNKKLKLILKYKKLEEKMQNILDKIIE